ncbi:MAG: type 4a pilus biogenesis protein PilO [bacterium]|nr:type 4a pilus biogenesis protein PilO [bacterium]
MKINKEGFEKITKKTYLEYIRLFPVLKKERNKQYGMLIFTFATMTFFGIFAINPTLTTIAELQRKLTDAKEVHQELSQKIDNLSVLQNKYAQLTPDLLLIEAALPQTVSATRFMGQLQAIVRQSGISVDGISFGALTLASNPKVTEGKFTFSLQASGTFSQINSFLNSLTTFDRIVVIDSLSLVKETVGGATVNLAIAGSASFKQ